MLPEVLLRWPGLATHFAGALSVGRLVVNFSGIFSGIFCRRFARLKGHETGHGFLTGQLQVDVFEKIEIWNVQVGFGLKVVLHHVEAGI